MRLIVALTGASGVVIGQRLLENLREHEVHLIVSRAARRVMAYELVSPELPAAACYQEDDLEAPLTSSSFLPQGMVIVPCSMKTLAGVALGYTDNLIARAADNVLRLGRPLVVVPRETPLSLAALENMRRLRLAGGIILPPNMAYYYQPRTVDDVTNFFVGKILDVLGLEHSLYRRWREGEAIC